MSCPSCGAPLPTRNPGIVVAVCEHCDTAITWDADAARDAGRKSRLPQGFTRLHTGATGQLEGKDFVVLGRARYAWGKKRLGGFWDEWCCAVDGRDELLWITEDDHELAAETARGRGPEGLDVRPGASVEIQGRAYVIEEVGHATCVGIEGQLPRDILPDETYRYADGSSPDGTHTLGLEWDDGKRPTLFVGRWLAPDELKLDDDGEDW